MCTRVLGVEDPAAYENHMCSEPRCSKTFPHLEKVHWEEHIDDSCECGQRRFKVEAGHILPVKR